VARAAFLLILLSLALVGLVFAVEPSLDVEIAKFLLLANQQGPLGEIQPLLFFVRDVGRALPFVAAALAIAAIVRKIVKPRQPMLLPSRATVLLLATLVVGPVLISNALFKENWSRPRPRAITELGGTEQFRPWWDPRGSCKRNCSFVSGEVSGAVSFLAPAAMIPAPWRYVAIGAVTAYGLAIGYIRMIAGGHFFTDVIFAASLTALVVWLLHGILCRWERTRVTDQSLESWIEHVAVIGRQAMSKRLAAIDGAVRKIFGKT
jgi:lipid A 4'-phosphatase